MTSLNHETVNGALVLKPARRIDSSSAKAFEDDAAALLDKGPKKVVIDATDLDYISSAGLRVILTTAKKATMSAAKCLPVKGPVVKAFIRWFPHPRSGNRSVLRWNPPRARHPGLAGGK